MTDETYNPDATDGDGDGVVQDGTEFERPVGTQLEGFDADATDGDGDGLVQDGTKFERPAPKPTVITGKSVGGSDEAQVLAPVENGVIGTATEKKPAPKPSAPKKAEHEDKVALFSEKNVFWDGVGRVSKGYNFVSESEAKKWLKQNYSFLRLATPEEIKQEFGK